MKLIGSLTSPFVRKVRIVLAEKKIEYDFALDSPWTPETNVPNINPLGKIPVLLLDDETVLFDSRVIAEYLDNVAPNNKLMPAQNRTYGSQALGSARRRLVRCRSADISGKEAPCQRARRRLDHPTGKQNQPQHRLHV